MDNAPVSAAISTPMSPLRLPARAESVARARRFVTRQLLAGRVAEPLVETAALLVSEIVTNAVVHAGGDVDLRVHAAAGQGALVEVGDRSPVPPATRRYDVDAMTGRGLALVDALSTSHGSIARGTGKVVWFTVGDPVDLPLPQDPAPDGDDEPVGPDGAATSVRLLGLPVGLYHVMRQHNEALLREYQLHLVGSEGAEPQRDISLTDLSAVCRARANVAAGVRRVVEDGGGGSGGGRADATVLVPADDVAALRLLPHVLDQAEALAREGAFLTPPALPELLALRNWLFAEVVRQSEGSVPVPWVLGAQVEEAVPAPPVAPDLSWVRTTDHAVLVADEGNRLVAVSTAAAGLLGWPVDELVGRRVTAVVPAEVREAHVAGFVHHVSTGQQRLIGQQVVVDALHRDGSLVSVTLRLERCDTGADTLFVGWLTAPEQPS